VLSAAAKGGTDVATLKYAALRWMLIDDRVGIRPAA
jgi:hypothetical protein